MGEISFIDVRESIFAENAVEASELRHRLAAAGVHMLNVTASPGAGKTTLIVETLRRLAGSLRVAVVEGDIASSVDAERIAAEGVPAVQVNTGGMCHLDVPMIDAALGRLDFDSLDLVLVENIGNLVCTADFDIGADASVVLLSVPEGDDKPLKYPSIFATSDALVITKTDYLPGSGFDIERVRRDVTVLRPGIHVLEVSARTGDGMDAWVAWLRAAVESKR